MWALVGVVGALLSYLYITKYYFSPPLNIQHVENRNNELRSSSKKKKKSKTTLLPPENTNNKNNNSNNNNNDNINNNNNNDISHSVTPNLDEISPLENKKKHLAIPDRFNSLAEVQEALRDSGLASSNLIIGVDYTLSNEYNGTRCFNGKSLHSMIEGEPNPYQQVITILGRTLESFDDDKKIPTFGFGDVRTRDKECFPFYEERVPFGFSEVLQRYNEITPKIEMSGPTNFAPIIYKAIEIVKQSNQYHILIIIADGDVICVKETANAIEEASKYPLSIIDVGIGDGPFDLMQRFDDELPKRVFDNFQFVNFTKVIANSVLKSPEAEFARLTLMEIPDQYKTICNLGYLNNNNNIISS